jgi:hypothetical protein
LTLVKSPAAQYLLAWTTEKYGAILPKYGVTYMPECGRSEVEELEHRYALFDPR